MLAQLALVCRAWNGVATPLLYGDLRVQWRWRVGTNLVRSFEANASLHRLVRSVTARYSTYTEWKHAWKRGGGGKGVEKAFGRLSAEERGVQAVLRRVYQEMDGATLLADEHWLTEPGRPLGSDAFWSWISLH